MTRWTRLTSVKLNDKPDTKTLRSMKSFNLISVRLQNQELFKVVRSVRQPVLMRL